MHLSMFELSLPEHGKEDTNEFTDHMDNSEQRYIIIIV